MNNDKGIQGSGAAARPGWVCKLWSTVGLLDAAGRGIYRTGNAWVTAATPPSGARPTDLFAFIPARVEVDHTGKTMKRLNAPDANLKVLKIIDPEHLNDALRECLADLFRHFPIAEPLKKP